MKKFIRKLMFLGYDRESLFSVKEEIFEENRRCIVLYSAIVVCGMAGLLFHSLFVEVLVSSRLSYLMATLIGLVIIFLAVGPAKKRSALTVLCQYLLVCSLLSFGILLGTVVEPNQASTSFSILIFVAPLLFTDLPYRINIVTVLSIIVYIFAARATQSDEMFAFNMSVILPYGLANLVLTHFTSKMKMERYIYAYEKKIMAEYDRLTRLRNRWSFEQDVEAVKNGEQTDIVICSFDVNQLKSVNDRFGHKAGDALLLAASGAIGTVVGKYGRCYRIGGDEFTAILTGAVPAPETLSGLLEEATAACHLDCGFAVSVAAGIVAGDSRNIDDLITEADKQMYENKSLRYLAAGNERRTKS